MRPHREPLPARRQVPEPHQPVLAARRQGPAVGRERQAPGPAKFEPRDRPLSTGGQIPDRDGPLARRGQRLAVAAEGEGARPPVVALEGAQRPFRVGLPDRDGREIPDRQRRAVGRERRGEARDGGAAAR
ncbi:MAG TPA: hypothetical protein VHS97_16340, partial [Isosphaeraceae bacterium]|nr:hypothetical protein [Isosphaeraceae bacterium]